MASMNASTDAFRGKAPGSGSGEMSKRTEALRPAMLLSRQEASQARQMRRRGIDPGQIADAMGKPLDEVEKALLQMRMPRPETTRGTLNVTLAAHRVILQERRGDEPLWQTFDRIVDEFLRLRRDQQERAVRPRRAHSGSPEPAPRLPGF
ncbi:hypothetical protein FE263_06020 [Lichenicoccus roseus]|uniref:Uncharacterized protein n=2 Tax=Lichenicoccus roseus TaxID=2683649 RepID=A0A5R9J614_9PROT|nr:hypothetical protein FE263_06020 [Lichenicoccus roseus]